MKTQVESAAVLVNNNLLPMWFVKGLRNLCEQSSVEISLVLIREDEGVGENDQSDSNVGLVQSLRNLVIRKFAYDPKEYINVESVDFMAQAPVVECPAIKDGKWRVRIPDGIVSNIEKKADVVIHLGFGILTGDILTQPEYGVVSYHHGDVRHYRGGPPGFWEFVHGKEQAGVIIQQLSEELDAGTILAADSVDISDANSWPEVKRQQYEIAPELLPEAISNLENENEIKYSKPFGPVYRTSDRTLVSDLIFLARSLGIPMGPIPRIFTKK